MSQLVTRAGSVDNHVAQTRGLGFQTKLASALDVAGNTLYNGVAGLGFRSFITLDVETTVLTGLTTGAALAGGVRLFDLPDAFLPQLARITGRLSLSAATATLSANAEIGLGTAVASGANATLGAFGATGENIIEGIQTAAISAAATITVDGTDDSRALVGTLGASTGIFLNFASAASGTAATNVIFTGQISIWGTLASHLP